MSGALDGVVLGWLLCPAASGPGLFGWVCSGALLGALAGALAGAGLGRMLGPGKD